jgi:hypothetical protein
VTAPRKPVLSGSIVLGEAASWTEVEAVLVAGGIGVGEAHAAVATRGVEGPDGFHILEAREVEAFCAEVAAIVARRRAAGEGARDG